MQVRAEAVPAFTVDFQVNGIEDTRLVRLFSLPGQVPLEALSYLRDVAQFPM